MYIGGSVLRRQKWIIVVINMLFYFWWSHRIMRAVSLYLLDVGVRREKRRCLSGFFCFIYTLP